ncbi:hypothetical protein BCR39DRAFT_210 [Naematelia encephala]|uniref:Phytanoyl-CoA dioxygenase n=1 Tax=Naematelia encephala TaxID=71784 RepID=A0A1Y2BKK6_9TREE|nr:hypothetical protein BCR39DRAFT_210 [Naematelia encephala]
MLRGSSNTTSASTEVATGHIGVLRLRSDISEYRRNIETNGFAVVRGVIPPERVEDYVNRSYDWLERFGPDFKRNDKSTWDVKNLPPHAKGGMYTLGGVAHEQFMWDIRCEPAVVDTFAQLWGTDELLVSYDGMNLALPLPQEQYDHGGKPWPHVDQSPLRDNFHCIQGIVALTKSEVNDGGLLILKGSKELYGEFFKQHEHEMPEGGWPTRDLYLHTEQQLQWFYDRGCKWEKICCDAGDLLIWDSRCVHYGAVPSGDRARVAAYVCYKPASMVSADALRVKQQGFKSLRNTTHDPVIVEVPPPLPSWDGYPIAPENPPVLDTRGQKLAGLVPY